jgi:hypothetical protein
MTDLIEILRNLQPCCPNDDVILRQQAADEIERLTAEVSRLRAAIHSVEILMQSSEGVAGLHLNGDVAPWYELLPGGRFEEWLEGWKEVERLTRKEI